VVVVQDKKQILSQRLKSVVEVRACTMLDLHRFVPADMIRFSKKQLQLESLLGLYMFGCTRVLLEYIHTLF